jgi:hypothetical protein
MLTAINTLPRTSKTWAFAAALIGLIIVVLMIGCSFGATPPLMKRKPPPKVLPVVIGGQKYEVIPAKPGVLKVTQLAGDGTRELLIYKQTIERGLEKDVQVRFISALKVEGKILVVEVEDGRLFVVSVEDDKVTERP